MATPSSSSLLPRAGCHRFLARLLSLCCAAALAGCNALTVPQRNQIAGLGLAVVAGTTPSNDLEQVYYLGSFDPREQLPPALYRIRVRGQASALSQMKFASSWVPAEVADALTGQVKFSAQEEQARLGLAEATGGAPKPFLDGRGLVMFGPEGFRHAPRNHRLVIVMGSSPEKVEQAFASALGTVAVATQGGQGVGLDKDVYQLKLDLSSQKRRLEDLLRAR